MSDPGADQDRGDMARLADGDATALDDLMSRHAGRLQACLFRLLQNAEDAEDLAQETFVRVYEHRDRFDRQRDFRTWLYTIGMNLVRDRFRWRHRHPESPLDPPEAGGDSSGPVRQLPDPRQSPAEDTLAEERAKAVRAALSELPEDLRLPLVLAEFEEESHARIGRILGCTAKAVEMKLYRARNLLRGRLTRWLDA